jgi:predicted component of type VI protein secretion system
MKLSLIVLAAGKQEGKVLEIKLPQFVIGRDPECHLRPASPMISKRHCALIQKDGKAYIKDFGSTNGSFVNDQQVQNAAVQLKNGDKLKIGPLMFEVRLEVDAAAPAAQQAAAKPAAAPAKPVAAAAKSTPTPPPAPAKSPQPAAKPQPAAAKPQPAAVGAQAKASPPPSSGEASPDDDIAAMLLSGEDETVSDGPAAKNIPQGTTVFELPIPNTGIAEPSKAGEEPKPGEPGKPGENKEKEKPKPQAESNSAVAAAILEKLRKRPRA